ncbi:unnamed protein product, partial [Didymodactylos carnosus]
MHENLEKPIFHEKTPSKPRIPRSRVAQVEEHVKLHIYTNFQNEDVSIDMDNQTNEFLSYLFFNDVKRAKELLYRMKDPIVACLIASSVFNTAAEIIGSNDYKTTYQEQADAVHDACNKIWFGDIETKGAYIHVKLSLTILLFPIAPLFVLCGFIPFRADLKKGKGEQIKGFYRAPVIVFYHTLLFSVGCLTVFDYVLLAGYYPMNIFGEFRGRSRGWKIPRSEIVLHIWLWSIILEEILKIFLKYSFI